jgi:hypothetical protein
MQNVTAATYWQHKVDGSGNWGLAVNGGTNAMTVLSANGNVGIGMTSGMPRLGILSANALATADLTFSFDATGTFRHGFSNVFSSATAANNTSTWLVWNAAGGQAQVMTANGAGNVGIGTASPGGRLDVQDTTNLCRLQVASASVTNRYHANVHQFLNNTAVGGVLATIQDGVGIRLSTIYSSLVFDAATAGQGLKLPATPGATGAGTEQILDCYQENTFTFTDASGAGLSFTANNTGIFTRVGRLVHCRADITYPSTANASNALIQLPATAGTYTATSVAVVGGVMMAALANSQGIEIYDAAGVRQTNANLSGKRIIVSLVYSV